ncbi:MAG: hypothetical protein HKN13_14575, partial [Rhodothermales bacterium]|nr:hypothetical protein [Rhodothermales bacterium]
PVSWQRIAALQSMLDQDLLRQFMEKQQRMAREHFSPGGGNAEPLEQAATESSAPDSGMMSNTSGGSAE